MLTFNFDNYKVLKTDVVKKSAQFSLLFFNGAWRNPRAR
jgi:hypothetical protein